MPCFCSLFSSLHSAQHCFVLVAVPHLSSAFPAQVKLSALLCSAHMYSGQPHYCKQSCDPGGKGCLVAAALFIQHQPACCASIEVQYLSRLASCHAGGGDDRSSCFSLPLLKSQCNPFSSSTLPRLFGAGMLICLPGKRASLSTSRFTGAASQQTAPWCCPNPACSGNSPAGDSKGQTIPAKACNEKVATGLPTNRSCSRRGARVSHTAASIMQALGASIQLHGHDRLLHFFAGVSCQHEVCAQTATGDTMSGL